MCELSDALLRGDGNAVYSKCIINSDDIFLLCGAQGHGFWELLQGVIRALGRKQDRHRLLLSSCLLLNHCLAWVLGLVVWFCLLVWGLFFFLLLGCSCFVLEFFTLVLDSCTLDYTTSSNILADMKRGRTIT